MLTDEQRQARKGKITSSLAAACLGLHPRMTQTAAWLAIRGEDTGIDTKATDRGNRLEDLILDYPAEVLGLVRERAPFRQHPSLPWAGDSSDAIYRPANDYRHVLVGEGKSASAGVANEYGEEGTDEVPHSTLIQSHWHLIHWPEVDRCVVPVLIGGYAFEFRLYYVDRDVELEGLILEDLAKWHRDYIVGDKVPPVTAGDESWIKERYPVACAGATVATPELEAAAKRYDAAHIELKKYEAAKKTAGAELRQLLGDHSETRGGWGSVTYRNTKPRSSVDYKAIVAHLGVGEDVIAQFTRDKPGPRVLRVNYKGG